MAVRKAAVILGGTSVYAGATLASYLYFSDVKDDRDEGGDTISHAKRIEIYDRNADQYDNELQWDEHLMGITLMRKFLLKKATGQVLEVCAGTGRNLQYYPSDCRRVTCTDASEKMLERAKELCKDIQPTKATCSF